MQVSLPNYLYMTHNSPFVRMVRVFIKLNPSDIRIQEIVVNLMDKSADLMENNPGGKVPKLTFQGETISDSMRILQFLSGVLNKPKLALKTDFEETVFETARDIMELAKANFYERKGKNNQEVIIKNEEKIKECILQLNTNCELLNQYEGITIAKIAIISAVDYVKNRGKYDWTQISKIDNLKQFHENLSSIQAFKDTEPEAL